MEELLRSNDPVLLSFVDALLKDANIVHALADLNMSVIEGSIGVLPRRILVPSRDLDAAKRIMIDAGLAAELNGPAG